MNTKQKCGIHKVKVRENEKILIVVCKYSVTQYSGDLVHNMIATDDLTTLFSQSLLKPSQLGVLTYKYREMHIHTHIYKYTHTHIMTYTQTQRV